MKKFFTALLGCILVLSSMVATPVVTPVHGETQPSKNSSKITIPKVYKGTDSTGQQLKLSDKLTATLPLAPINFYADLPGSWTVSGTGQSSSNTRSFTLNIPNEYAGYSMQLTYLPQDPKLQIYRYKIQIQVPSASTGNSQTSNTAIDHMQGNMDIVARGNIQSSYLVDANDLSSSNDIYTVYQDPIFDVWVTTDADHFRFGSRHDSEEGSGVWSVNHLLVDNSYLNFDHTALNLAKFGAGTYEIEYTSKDHPEYKWYRKIKLFKGILDTSEYCESGESGPAMPNHPVYLLFKDDTGVGDGGVVTIKSVAQLSKLAGVSLFADHVVKNGMKKITKSGLINWVPSVEWNYEVVRFGEERAYPNTRIRSGNRVEVLYDDEVLYELGESSMLDDVTNGERTLDLRNIIKDNDYRKGTYTINVYNDLYRESCSVYGGRKTVDQDTNTQRLSATIQFE